MMTVELRHNTAEVTAPISIPEISQPESISWFDWSGYTSSPSGSSSGDFMNRAPLFSASVQVALRLRNVDVRYMTLQELVSEVSGTWAVCLLFGMLTAIFVERGCGKSVLCQRMHKDGLGAGRNARGGEPHAPTVHELVVADVQVEASASAKNGAQFQA